MGVESPVNKRTEAAAVPTLRNHWCRHFRGLVLRNELENRGIRQDGDQRGGQSRVVNLRRNQPRMQRDLGDDEREFSDLSQAHSHLEGSLPRVSEHTHNSCPDKKFSHHDQSNKQSEHSPASEPGPRINEHANSDKEKGDEGVADRERLLRQLVSKVRAAQQEAREKSAEGQRQADRLR